MIFNLNLNLLLLFSQINICANRNILLRRFHLRYLKIFVSVPFNCHLIIRKNSSIFEYVENYGINRRTILLLDRGELVRGWVGFSVSFTHSRLSGGRDGSVISVKKLWLRG